MREKYESLSAFVLKDLAKARGLKGISSLKKGQIIDRMLEEDEKEAKEAAANGISDEDRVSSFRDDYAALDSGEEASGILEVMSEGFGFIRCENYMPGDHDIYVAPSQIRRFNLKTGDIIKGNTKVKSEREKFQALLYVTSVNGYTPAQAQSRTSFENLIPIFPDERLRLERKGASVAMRVVDLISPIGKGQRGMIVSQPKAGKTTLLKEVAKSVKANNPEIHLIILLIDERPEEVTDIKEAIEGDNVEVIYSTFDELPEHHKRVSEMVIERAKRLVEHGQDVMILLDSITRLARAYNMTVPPSGRTLSGGLDPAALHMPKRFFGAARNMRNGGSLTILATALVDTGSKMDDVVFEEFKGTGNMELVLDRKLSEKRIFPAIDIVKSGTRREDLLLDEDEQAAVDNMRKAFNSMRSDEAVENVLNMFAHTKSNKEFVNLVKKNRIL
ncbi:MAG: transcription termination factor Rho [Agathobacter sp.]|uniref:transcription termination factor Rho n=1 Tax=Agathobacter sp. TaxID=2021311 RepID=UPI002E7793BF|nr:transcription termination factor Rho [Agathobacter sp.]MEE1216016.1 transcription termination factor Rho [Agathobacter sp.]